MRALFAVVEPVTVAETDEVARFIAHVIDASVDATPEHKQMFLENVRRNLAQWRDAPDRSVHLKAVSDRELAGVIMVKDYSYLCHLFVAPAEQRLGIGASLLEAAVARCKARSSHPHIRLVAARNAVGFYTRMGFTPKPDESLGDGLTPFELRL